MDENNSKSDDENIIIEHNEEGAQSDTAGPVTKVKKPRGRPKVDHSNDPPKPNRRKVRSEKQQKAWDDMQATNKEVREEIKRRKEEHLAEVYMKKKEREKAKAVESESELEYESESSVEVEVQRKPKKGKTKAKPKKAKAKPKKVKKVVYVSESESESESEPGSEYESEYESESEVEEAPKRRSKHKVYVERESAQPAFNPNSYFV